MTTIAAWFLYSAVVANLLGLAAVAGESALRSSGRPGRWAWAAALVLSVGLPLLAWAGVHLRSVPAVPQTMFLPLAPLVVEVGAVGDSALVLDEWLLTVWTSGSLLVGLLLAVSWLSLNGQRREWRPDLLEGVPVMVARNTGPAVLGVRYPDIVVPEWALSLESRVRRLMLLHEGEHVRAGDTRLVAFGLLVVAAAPWNLALWWQFRRLRQAVELDCDTRVLRRAPDTRRYGALLIEVGRRRSMPMLGVALAEPSSFLERRIRQITRRTRVSGLGRILALTAAAVLLSGAAVLTRDPMALAEPSPVAKANGEEYRVRVFELVPFESGPEPEAVGGGPFFTPMTVAPAVVNGAEVIRALQRNYPPLLRDAGIGGEANIWFHIDGSGAVQQVQLNQSSGYPALDEAALRVARTMRFSPALNRDQVVAVWVSLPIRFVPRRSQPAGGQEPEPEAAGSAPSTGRAIPLSPAAHEAERRTQSPSAGEMARQAPANGLEAAVRDAASLGPALLREQMLAETARLAEQTAVTIRALDQRREEERRAGSAPQHPEQPTYTAMTEPPRIVNEAAVAAALRREFQRTGELAGSVNLWFYIDETGKVVKTMVDHSSGSAAVDEAALRVAGVFRFAPARNRERLVPVWISLPIRFTQG